MADRRSIVTLSQQIARRFKPERIILFGSYASGKPRQDSDVDLLVILSHTGSATRKALEILAEVNPPIPVDLMVRTPDEIRRRLAWNDFFLREIMETGKVLYESAHP